MDRNLLSSKADSTDIFGFCLPVPFLRNPLRPWGRLPGLPLFSTAGQCLPAGLGRQQWAHSRNTMTGLKSPNKPDASLLQRVSLIVSLNPVLEPQVNLDENRNITRYFSGYRIPDRNSPFSRDLKYLPQFSPHWASLLRH